MPRTVDDAGRVTWPRLVTGPHVLTVLAGDCVVHEERFDAGPGSAAEHVVHLGGGPATGPR